MNRSNKIGLKILASSVAICILALRIMLPQLNIDMVTLGLIVLAIVPWISRLVDSIELPGGVKIPLRNVESAGEKVRLKEELNITDTDIAPSKPQTPIITTDDANLALVALRIEIEKRLRSLAKFHGMPENHSLKRTVNTLREKGIIDTSTASGLVDLINAGNNAAHGASVDPQISDWAADKGFRVIAALDSKISVDNIVVSEAWLNEALIILKFYGSDFLEICISLLSSAKRDSGKITLFAGEYGDKDKAREILERLGAIVRVEDDTSPRWGIHYILTPKGNILLSQLLSL